MSKKVWIGAGLVVAAVAWYAFRPELLFVNKSVSESFPSTSVAANASDATASLRPLAEGQFKGYAHEIQGAAKIYKVNGLCTKSRTQSGFFPRNVRRTVEERRIY
jgi:hypothetical protein